MNKPTNERTRITTLPGNYPRNFSATEGTGNREIETRGVRTRAEKGDERAAPGWKLRGGPERADRRLPLAIKTAAVKRGNGFRRWLSCRLEFMTFCGGTHTRRVHKSRGCRIFGCRFCFATATESPLQLRVQSSRDKHTRANTYTNTTPAHLFIPRNSRKVKADSIEPPTCTRKRTYP